MKYPVRYVEAEEGGWLAEVLACGKGGFTTQGETLEDARQMARDAVTEVLLADFDNGIPFAPTPDLPPGYEWVYPFAQAWMSIAIRQQRKAAGLTLEAAAARMGVSRGTYQRWEDPYKSNATLKTLEKVAQALGKQLEVSMV